MPDGEYALGNSSVQVRGGVCRDAEGRLAGSTLTQDEALRNLIQWTGMRLDDALLGLTANPARPCLSRAEAVSSAGAFADMTFLDENLEVARTYCWRQACVCQVTTGTIPFEVAVTPIPMDKLRITGGRKLEGQVRISGAKNSALPAMAASLLTAEEVLLTNIPLVADIWTTRRLLRELGVQVEFEGDHAVRAKAEKITSHEAPYDLVKTMRASVLALGPLLARTGKARVSLPGGCAIGARPINLHLKGIRKTRRTRKDGTRLCRSGSGNADGRKNRLRQNHSYRNGEPDDGCGTGEGHERSSRTRRASRKSQTLRNF